MSDLLILTVALASLLLAAAPSHAQSWSATWSQKSWPIDQPDGVGGRGWIDLTFDSVNRQAVLMAGSSSIYLNDVWWYNPVSDLWMALEPPVPYLTNYDFVPPCPRDEMAIEYDPVNQLYWMFGGSGSGCLGPSRTAGSGTTATTIADSTLSSTVVDFYKDWTVRIGSARVYVSAYNPASKTLTLTTPIAGAAPGAQYRLHTQRGGGTWYYSPVTRTWGSLTGPRWGYTGPSPASRLSPALAYSSRDNSLVMFGGQGANDTWALDVLSKTWVPLLPDGGPSSPPGLAQITNAMVYDSANDVFILFGGCLCTGDYGPSAGDTWVYRLSTNAWTRMNPGLSPPARNGHNVVYDSANGVAVLFGGYDPLSWTFYNDLWVYRYATNTWTQVAPAVSPPARRTAGMTYDPLNRLTILYGGGSAVSGLRDVWVLNLQGSSSANPAPSVTSLSPSSATAGGPGFTLIVTGANFVSGSVVRWNGADRQTTYVRSTQLQAAIPASNIAGAGTAQVSVFTPSPGGGTSNALPFTVVAINPGPVTLNAPATITATTPVSASPPGFGLTMSATLAGKTFVGGTVAANYRFRMVEIATGYVNDLFVAYGTAAPSAGLAYVRNGQYDISVSLVNSAGVTLVDTAGAAAVVGPVRVTVPVPSASVTLNAPATITAATPASTTPPGHGLTMSATLAGKTFAGGTLAANYRFRIVEIATGYVNDLLVAYGTAAPSAGFAYVRNGQYDVSVSLENSPGVTLVDTSGAAAVVGPVRVTVPVP